MGQRRVFGMVFSFSYFFYLFFYFYYYSPYVITISHRRCSHQYTCRARSAVYIIHTSSETATAASHADEYVYLPPTRMRNACFRGWMVYRARNPGGIQCDARVTLLFVLRTYGGGWNLNTCTMRTSNATPVAAQFIALGLYTARSHAGFGARTWCDRSKDRKDFLSPSSGPFLMGRETVYLHTLFKCFPIEMSAHSTHTYIHT